MNDKTTCRGKVWRHHYFYPCGNPGAIEEDGKKWCGIHAPSKVKAKEAKARSRSGWRGVAWDFDSKIRGAEDAVILAAEEVYKSQVGAGWEIEQQRLAVHRLVRAYGELERLQVAARIHDTKRPAGIRKV